MTSLQHDDGIEIIAFQSDHQTPHPDDRHSSGAGSSCRSGYYNISSPTDSHASSSLGSHHYHHHPHIHHARTAPGYYHHLSCNSGSGTSPAGESKNTYFSVGNGDQLCVLSRAGGKEVPTEKQKRVARVVMVIAGVLLLMSILLVGVTLTMSDHIDDMVRKANGLHTTSTPSRVNRSVSFTEHNPVTAR